MGLKARLKSSLIVVIFVVTTLAIPQLFLLHKVLFALAAAMAIVEIIQAFYSPSRIRLLGDPDNVGEDTMLQGLLFGAGAVAYLTLSRWQCVVLILGCIACDTLAYAIGKLLGQKFIHARPFPEISPKKTYEGTIGGIICASLVTLAVYALGSSSGYGLANMGFFEWTALFTVGTLCVIGDLLGSAIKRRLRIKDSNTCTREHPIFKYPEALMSGFGGYLDRLDSICFTSFAIASINAVISH